MSLRASPPMPPPPPMGENTQMVDIPQPHKHDVLCGRGVTTNRFPGNESFRSLVSLNKELYVTSTKRQKMSISRSIVEAVRSLKPPGRFLEKNPVTGLWSDIGDRKAIEKTSQALRDGAAGLRKELSEDLGDPDFLSAVFDMDSAAAKSKAKPGSPSVKDKDKPVKAKPIKKGHRRTKSNPSVGSKAAAAKTVKKPKSQESDSSNDKSSRPSSLPPRAPTSPGSPRSSHLPTSPPRGGWSMRFPPGSRSHRGPYPPPSGPPPEHYKSSRPYHRSHSYHATPHGPPPRPPHGPPHTWSHAPPPRYRGPPTSPPNVVHTPQSPLPPGRHQLTPNGCISKPPLSPVPPVARWSPRHFPRYPPPYPPHPDYGPPPGRPGDYPPPPPGRPEYSRSHPGHPPEYWPPYPGDPYGHHHPPPPPHHRGHRDHYYHHHHDHHYPAEGLDVPTLGGERDYHHRPRPRSDSRERPGDDHYPHPSNLPPQEFSPPVTPSRRRKPDKMSTSSSASSTGSSSPSKPDPSVDRHGGRGNTVTTGLSNDNDNNKTTTTTTASTPDRMSDNSEGTRNSVVMMTTTTTSSCEKTSRSCKGGGGAGGDDATQKTVMSPLSEAGGDVEAVDVEMVDCGAPRSNDNTNSSSCKVDQDGGGAGRGGRQEPLPPNMMPPLRSSTNKDHVHIISVVHQMDDTTGEVEEGIEFMLKDPTADDYSLSPLPFEREDPTTLMELPDDILHLPISSCGPHDD